MKKNFVLLSQCKKYCELKFPSEIFLVLIVLLLGMTSIVSATDYYVSTSGDNSDTGLSIDHAWATIQHAVDTVGPGDTVYVQNGTYNENVVESTDGTSDNRIIFQGVDNPVIDASGGVGFNIEGEYVTVTGFYIKNAIVGIQVYRADYATVSYNVMDDFSCGKGITIHGPIASPQNNIHNPIVEYNVINSEEDSILIYEGVWEGSISYNTLNSSGGGPLRVYRGGRSVGSENPPAYGWIYYVDFIDNTLRGSRTENGLNTEGLYHCYIANNNIKDYGHNGISIHGAQYCTFENNWIGPPHPDSPGGIGGIYSCGNRYYWHSNTFRNNDCEDIDARGFCVDNGRDTIVENLRVSCSNSYGIDMLTSGGLGGVSGNGIFKNVTLNVNGYKLGIRLAGVKGDYFFSDVALSGVSISGWYLLNNKATVHVINANVTSAYWHYATEGEFRTYYPVDVKVEDSNGNPVEGANVTITNDVDSNYPSVNYNWERKTTFTTGVDGHTPLPSDREDTATIMYFRQTVDEKTYMSHTITAEKDGYSNSTTVNPDSSWYRSNPDTYQNTVTLVLPLSQSVGTISGTVTDVNGTAIEDATVQTGGYLNTTNSTGGYILILPVSNHTVTASAAGYQSQSKPAEVLENQTTEVNFTLTVATTTTTTTSTSTTSTSTTSTSIAGTTTTAETTSTTSAPTTTIKKSSGGSSGGGGGGGGFSAITVRKETCFDGLINQNETGVDCGGPCEPCPTCTDDILNQGEEGVDCGGPCEPCVTTSTTSTVKLTTTTVASTTSIALETTSTTAKITTTTIPAEEKDFPWIWVIAAAMVIGAAAFLAVKRGKGTKGETMEEEVKSEVAGKPP